MYNIEKAYKLVRDDLANYVFVNFPYEQEIIEHDLENWKAKLKHEIEANEYVPSAVYIAEVPKPNWAIRPGAILPIKDHVAFTSFVDACYEEIHGAILWSQDEVDFAYRLNQDVGNATWFHGQFKGWKAFKDSGLNTLSRGYSHVVFTDITGFYENIDHALLLSDLRQVGVSNEVISKIRTCIQTWSQISTKGIPQGNCASHLLAKLYLNAVDQKLVDLGFKHQHYSDDYRIFCNNLTEAKEVLKVLTALLRKRGLNLQSAKSMILKADEAKNEIEGMATVIENLNAKIIQELSDLYSNPYEAIFAINTLQLNEQQIETIRTAFSDSFVNNDSKKFNKSFFHYLLNKLGASQDAFAVDYCIRALIKHPQESSYILEYFNRCSVGEDISEKVLDIVCDNTSIYDYQNYQLMNWLHERDVKGRLLDIARKNAFDNNLPIYCRALARKILGANGTTADLERLYDCYDSAVTENEQCALLCSLSRLESGRRNAFYSKPQFSNGIHKQATNYAKSI